MNYFARSSSKQPVLRIARIAGGLRCSRLAQELRNAVRLSARKADPESHDYDSVADALPTNIYLPCYDGRKRPQRSAFVDGQISGLRSFRTASAASKADPVMLSSVGLLCRAMKSSLGSDQLASAKRLCLRTIANAAPIVSAPSTQTVTVGAASAMKPYFLCNTAPDPAPATKEHQIRA